MCAAEVDLRFITLSIEDKWELVNRYKSVSDALYLDLLNEFFDFS